MRTDQWLFYFTVALITIGIVFSLSLTSYTTLASDTEPLYFFKKQWIFGMFSIFLMWGLSQFNPDKVLTPFCMVLWVVSGLVMISMGFMPKSIVSEVNGAARWIKIAGISIAPVEFFKVGFIYFLAWSFSRKMNHTKKTVWQEIKIWVPYVFLFAIFGIVIAIGQKDLGQVAVLAATMICMSFFAGTSMRLVGIVVGIIGILGYTFVVTSPHRIVRIRSWWAGVQDTITPFLSPETAAKVRVDDANMPYQVGHSLNAINNGELMGAGLGQGSFKLGYLSEVHTDFVLAGIAEEIGFFGILGVVLLFSAMLARVFRIASKSVNSVYFLFGLGIAFMLFFSFCLNSYGITGLIPMKGIAVPFLSYGGSHVIAASMAVGFILMISKRANLRS
ncbi:FtsW/RodA/SpoVE family cell cycle protein [Campylobacter sp. JMF_02 ED1]|uniref:FtsW/RodA/SpoVE family cell cycle protein n=1 Tax=unclassified Campylobacter TaxID=2593542 RepID=UPI0022E9C712|nr:MULTISPECIES: FtsW/RodA/SpoVE family cell cycle protein [unclassified Campylobacter]MDA3049335.1 FtsW/RodA/SpoVE family cell cycle protein [Campylobacter sp. JMF_15 NE4]MDA3051239.1 FtsW/RodA/SpoVE family cell cycle protein [Campylobacter sp. JMF_02 ED1]MDA3076357.1 FtsW/RodA/SpoVE family cell cycle protein [Campylobacter sp. JMF_04 NA10]MDA3077569.1 FtsW/RodA/SpoVE family cell cycle protein [Campylobacter sp. JMF_06 NA1]